MISLKSKNGEILKFRLLEDTDSVLLGDFFSSLSKATKSKYGPHPLTNEQAKVLCESSQQTQVYRFVALLEEGIVGYFILDFSAVQHEIERYNSFGIQLTAGQDPFFAPCISDQYQNMGISSLVMPELLSFAKAKQAKSIVLLGGTQETNTLGISFYKKWGFKPVGGYVTEVNNIDMRLVL